MATRRWYRQARTERCIDDLVEPARAKTLDLLGDGKGALSRLRGWLVVTLAEAGARAHLAGVDLTTWTIYDLRARRGPYLLARLAAATGG